MGKAARLQSESKRRTARAVLARAAAEALEPRVVLASIAGTVWQDRNGDGARDAGEPALAGRTVYVDADNDAVKDAGERTAITNAAGAYTLTGLIAGTHVVRQAVLPGWRATSTGEETARRVTVGISDNVTGADLGTVVDLLHQTGSIENVEYHDNWLLHVSIDGDRAVAGHSGGAVFFERDAQQRWDDVAYFETPGPLPPTAYGRNFGEGVDIRGDTAVVGAPDWDGRGDGVGYVYVYQRNASGIWTQSDVLGAPGGSVPNQYFGGEVVLEGDTLLVAAPGNGTSVAGKVYVYHRDGAGAWTFEQQFGIPTTPPNPAVSRLRGALEFDGITIAVNALHNDGTTALHGTVHTFTRDANGNFVPRARLTAPSGSPNVYFGAGVKLAGDRLFVGAPEEQPSAIYEYRSDGNGGWTQRSKIVTADASFGEGVGHTLQFAGGALYAGAYEDDAPTATDSGSVYVFRQASPGVWYQTQKLYAPSASSQWGIDLATDGTSVLFGTLNLNGPNPIFATLLPAYLTGTTWQDRDGDGVHDAGEPGAAARTVYVDYDDDGMLDTDEPSTLSDSSGNYAFDSILPGRHVVRQIIPSDWSPTATGGYSYAVPSPMAASHVVTLGPGETLSGIELGSSPRLVTQPQVLTAAGVSTANVFGEFATAVRGNVAVIGSQYGSAYVYERGGAGQAWSQVAVLTPPEPVVGQFGASAAIADDLIAVGAPLEGAVYLFRKQAGSWAFSTKLTAFGGSAGDSFGGQVVLRDDMIAVSAHGDDGRGVDSGAVYVFLRDGADSWAQTQKLHESDAVAGGGFSEFQLVLDGDTLAARAFHPGQPGAVYLFRETGAGQFTEVARVRAPQPAVGDGFAGQFALSGDRLAVTASAGVYVYRRTGGDTWTNLTTLLPATPDAEWFGYDMAFVAGGLLIGAPKPTGLGTFYVFEDDGAGTWRRRVQDAPAGVRSGKRFGSSVGADGGTFLISMPYGGLGDSPAGAVWSYDVAAAGYLTGTVFSDVDASGSRAAGEPALAGWTVWLDTDDDGVQDAGEATAATAANGTYQFVDLLPGQYVVRIVAQDEWSQTSPSLSDGHRVTLSPGQTAVGDFGVVNRATVVTGVAWNDRNADVVRDAVEPVLSGRTVYWDGNDNGVLDAGEVSTTTAADGSWTIRNVPPGPRVFRQVVPVGWQASSVAGTDVSRRISPAPGQTTAAVDFGSALLVPMPFQIVLASDGQPHDHFGYSSAVSGDYSIVGAAYADDATRGADSGAAYIYHRVAGVWTQAAKLTAPDGQSGDTFGSAVALDGDTAVVTSFQDDDRGAESGSAYVFRRNGSGQWQFQVKLTGADGVAGDYFGTTAAMRGDVLVVGAQGVDDRGTQAGAAYVFERNGSGAWQQTAKLTASDGGSFDALGWTGLAVGGNRIAVGAANHGSGVVYLYERNGGGAWTQVDKLTGANASRFGYSIALDGDTIAVGADGVGSEAGAVYVLTRNASGVWVAKPRFTGGDTVAGDRLGASVALVNGVVYAGAINNSGGRGAIYSFREDGSGTWVQASKLSAPQAVDGDSFGWGLSAGGTTVVAGAYLRDDFGTDRGAAYFMELRPASYLTGAAFNDANKSGAKDAGEAPLENWTVWLDVDDDGSLDAGEPARVIDANGRYAFDDLVAGNYVVRQQPQALWTQTRPASDQPYRVTVAPGQTFVGDFGMYATATAAGVVFADANGNGAMDSGETPLPNWVVFGDLNANRKLDPGERTTVTGADGAYTLSDLAIQPTSIDVIDGATWGIMPRPVALEQRPVFTGVDFASAPAAGQSFPTSGTIVGSAVVDVDGNGEVDAFETERVANVSFSVYLDDGDGVFEPGLGDSAAGTVVTGAGGSFVTNSLAPGGYWLRIDPNSGGMLGYSLFGRPEALRGVVAAQKPQGRADFSILKAYTVTTLADEIPGGNTPAHVSLREALDLVRVDGRDTGVIVFDPSLAGGTVTLDATDGQLLVRDSVSILGPAGAPITLQASGTSRVMSLSSGVVVELQDLVLAGGSAATGGGLNIGFGAAVTGRRLTVRDNAATQRGGGIYVSSGGTLSLTESAVSENSATLQGGGIYLATDTTLALRDVTVDANSATGANGDGGGLFVDGAAYLTQATISGNRANRHGGGVRVNLGEATGVQSTIADNTADADANGSGTGGGVSASDVATLRLRNTLVAANRRGASSAEDVGGALTADSANNVVAALTPPAPGGGATANQFGTTAAPLDGGLLPLGNYGGATRTHALLRTSPAIEAGGNAAAAAAGLTVDQAGSPRFRDFDGDGAATVDVGAFEAAKVTVVDAAALDEAVDTDGKTSLREALAAAAAEPGLNVVTFDPAMFAATGAATITLGGTELVIDSDVEIEGPANAALAVSAGTLSRVFRVTSAGTATLNGFTVTGGAATAGAGVLNEGRLTLSRMLVTANTAGGDGGAVASSGGTLTVTNSTLSGNAAGGSGGAVAVSGGTFTAVNATVVDNTAAAAGGGVSVAAGVAATLSNAVVAGNRRGAAAPDDVAGAFAAASSYNFVGTIDGSTGLTGVGAQYGTAAAPADPLLHPLADNGGPTRTHAVRPASPVTDAGSNALVAAGPAFDQRGQPRVRDGTDDGLARVDVGAFEQQVPLNRAPVLTTVATVTGGVESVPLTITHAQLLSLSDAHDPDGSPVAFRVESAAAGGGALTLDGAAVVPGVTLVWPGQALVWAPPGAIDFAGQRSRVVDAFAVSAWDGQVGSGGAPVPVKVEVTTTAEPVNYAVLFSGGDRADLNYPIYHQNLRRLYGILTTQYGLQPHDITVVYADGTAPGPDQRGNVNSDMSFAAGSTVLSATGANLRQTLMSVAGKADANDHFFFWTFDHGLGSTNKPADSTEEVLKGWGPGEEIADEKLRAWTQGLRAGESAAAMGVPEGYQGVRAGFSTYVFAQCFAGGMLDEFDLTAANVFGASSSNHYEASYADYFAAAFNDALAGGFVNTKDAYRFTVAGNGRARPSDQPNGGSWTFNVEHPWSGGGSFPMFATAREQNAAPELRSVAPLRIPAGATELTVTYDMLVAASDATDPAGQALVFRVASEDVGEVWRDNHRVNLANPADTTIGFNQSVTWKRPAGAATTVNAFTVKLVAADGAESPARVVPVRAGSPAGLAAADDAKQVQQNSSGFLIDVLGNDTGSGARVVRLGVPSAGGTVSLDPATGQLRYTPAAEFLGTDEFSYLLANPSGTTTDLATVTVSVVPFDPAAAAAEQRYTLTQLPPPPGWAGLPSDWPWDYRLGVPNWTESYAVDISDSGAVVVGIARPWSTAVDYIGNSSSSYRWSAGDVEPFWNVDLAGQKSSTNTQTMIQPMSHPDNPLTPVFQPAPHTDRRAYAGVTIGSVGNSSVWAGSFKWPNNAQDKHDPHGLIFEPDTSTDLWQQLPTDIYITDISPTLSNYAGYLAAANRSRLGELTPDGNTMPDRAEVGIVGPAVPGTYQRVVPLPELGGDGGSRAKAINDDGWVVGNAEYARQLSRPFLYDGQSMIDLGGVPGYAQGSALAVSDAGHVVGYSANSLHDEPTNGRGFVWFAGTLTALAPAGGGTGWSAAYDVNVDGVVVGSSFAPNVGAVATAWVNGQAINLNERVQAGDLPDGVVLTAAKGINRSGQIVATGTVNGKRQAFLLDLTSSLQASADQVETSSRQPKQFNVLANDRNARTVSQVFTQGLAGTLAWDPSGQMTFNPAGAFDDLEPGETGTTSFRYVARDNLGGEDEATVSITVNALGTFHVVTTTADAAGVTVRLSGDVDLAALNVYDGPDAAADAADVSLTGPGGAAVRGSVVWEDATDTLRFIPTAGPLAAGAYTFRMLGNAGGVASAAAGHAALDGDANDAAGGTFTHAFTVAAAPATGRTLSLGNFARGPGQAIEVAALGGGVPLYISDGTGVRAVQFDLRYDPSLFTPTGFEVPAGWTPTLNFVQPGLLRVGLGGGPALGPGRQLVARMTGVVPAAAPYGATHALRLEDPVYNGEAVGNTGGSAVHVVAFPGDATGSATYGELDPPRIARIAVGLETGFDGFGRVDPLLIGDVDNDGVIRTYDAVLVADRVAGLSVPEIPPAGPAGAAEGGAPITDASDTPAPGDPAAAAPAADAPVVAAAGGATVTLANLALAGGAGGTADATIDNAEGLEAFILDFAFDPARLRVASAVAGSLLPAGGWTVSFNPNFATGRARAVAYTTQPLTAGAAGAILRASVEALAGAPAGETPLTLSGSLNEGAIVMTPQGGTVTIAGASPPPAVVSSVVADGMAQRTVVRQVTVTFDRPVSLAAGAFVLTGPNGAALSPAVTAAWSASGTGGAAWAVTFSGSPVSADGRLPKGNYELRAVASKVTAVTGGTAMAADHVAPFFVLPGDANGDRSANIADFGIMQNNYNRPGTPGQGDFNGDGQVNIADWAVLQNNYNQTIAPPAAPSPTGSETGDESGGETGGSPAAESPAPAVSPSTPTPAATPTPTTTTTPTSTATSPTSSPTPTASPSPAPSTPTPTQTQTATQTQTQSQSPRPAPPSTPRPANAVPAVSLTRAGTATRAPAAIRLNAAASDRDGRVRRVEFYRGDVKIGEDSAAPYTLLLTGVVAGTHVFSARAVDDRGGAGTSAPLTITLAAAAATAAAQPKHAAIARPAAAQTPQNQQQQQKLPGVAAALLSASDQEAAGANEQLP